jgi:hypothetical protein
MEIFFQLLAILRGFEEGGVKNLATGFSQGLCAT